MGVYDGDSASPQAPCASSTNSGYVVNSERYYKQQVDGVRKSCEQLRVV